MVDRRPSRTVAGERATLVGLLQFQRESLVRKVTGVGDEAARKSPVGSGTSLLAGQTPHLGRAVVVSRALRG